jgi:hypothetical protein
MQSHLKNFTTQRYILIFPMELMYTAVLTQQHWKNYGKKTKAAIRKIVTQTIEPIACLSHTVPLFRSKNILLIPHSLDLLEWLKRTEDDVIGKS